MKQLWRCHFILQVKCQHARGMGHAVVLTKDTMSTVVDIYHIGAAQGRHHSKILGTFLDHTGTSVHFTVATAHAEIKKLLLRMILFTASYSAASHNPGLLPPSKPEM